MGLFDFLLHRPDFEEGLERWRAVPGAVLLDVRTPEEYRSGHVPGAVNLPLDRLHERELPADRPVFAYCLSGARSRQAAMLLRRAGYAHVTDLGGICNYHGKVVK